MRLVLVINILEGEVGGGFVSRRLGVKQKYSLDKEDR